MKKSAKTKKTKCSSKFLTLLLFLTGTFQFSFSESPKKFRVGVILPLTGVTADYGEAVRNSIELAREDRKDLLQNADFLYEDAGYDPKQAVSAFHKLVHTDHVDAVYVWGVVFCKVLAPLAESSKVPMIGQCIDPEIGRSRKYVLRFMNYTDQYLLATTQYLAEHKLNHLEVILTESSYLEEMYAALERNLQTGQTVKVLQRFPPGEMDFRSVISSIKKSDSQAIGVFLSAGQIAGFYRQMREQKVSKPTFGTNFFDSLSEVQAAAGAMEGAVFAVNDVKKEFIDRYQKKFGRITQIAFGALAYEFALTLGTMIQKFDPKDITSESMQDLFTNIGPEKGIAAGPYVYRRNSSVGNYFEFPIVMKEIRNNEFKVLPFKQSAKCSWPGTYEWTENAGRNAGGDAIIVNYTVSIDSTKDGLSCSISKEGYQSDETILCEAKVDGDSISLLFSSYADGNIENSYGVKVYEKTEKLLSFKCIESNGKTNILTYWGSLGKNTKQKDGKVYFKKN